MSSTLFTKCRPFKFPGPMMMIIDNQASVTVTIIVTVMGGSGYMMIPTYYPPMYCPNNTSCYLNRDFHNFKLLPVMRGCRHGPLKMRTVTVTVTVMMTVTRMDFQVEVQLVLEIA